MMSRSLRSISRWQKLQVQQIKQAGNDLRLNIKNRTGTSVEGFEQQEFLSLFELIPAKPPPNGIHKSPQPVAMQKRISTQGPFEDIVKLKTPIKRKRKPLPPKRTLPPRLSRAPASTPVSTPIPPPARVNHDESNNNQFDTRFKRKITLENYISEACQVQGTLLARNQYLLNELYHAIADHRKYVYLDELEKQRNIILQIMIREIDTKMTFLRNHNT